MGTLTNELRRYPLDAQKYFEGTQLSQFFHKLEDIPFTQESFKKAQSLAQDLYSPLFSMLMHPKDGTYWPNEVKASDETYEFVLSLVAQELARAMAMLLVSLPEEQSQMIRKALPIVAARNFSDGTSGSHLSAEEVQLQTKDPKATSLISLQMRAIREMMLAYEKPHDTESSSLYIALQIKSIVKTFFHELGHEIQDHVDPVSRDLTTIANQALREGNYGLYNRDPGEMFCRFLSNWMTNRLASTALWHWRDITKQISGLFPLEEEPLITTEDIHRHYKSVLPDFDN